MSSSEHIRRTVLHRALHRPNLLMGGERELVMFAILLSGGMAVSALNIPSIIIGLVLWSGSILLLRVMAKSDPSMSSVYRRHLRYEAFYPPRSSNYRTN